ncbi:MAG TPA: glycosyltransferase [Candidatus Polarisedimenticolia bacterium]|nr:glycosyltransferase [Candidatus Polarisedimenticolia bacterium]
MNVRPVIIGVTPHHPIDARNPTRPGELANAISRSSRCARLDLVVRSRPRALLRRATWLSGPRIGRWPLRRTRLGTNSDALEHPWPFGYVEDRFLERLVRTTVAAAPGGAAVLIWDPKSAGVLKRLSDLGPSRLVRVLDAYDAWDLSPLVHGRRRQAAVVRGYESAAASADVVLANSAFMAERMRGLGARNVVRLPNGAPERLTADQGAPAYFAYVGRIHERVDATLLAAVADAFPAVEIRIAGGVEREPAAWAALASRPNVRLIGPLEAVAARRLIAGAAALLLPHVVDDYTRSQDPMKAWDALASGTPVVSTPLPPVTEWPEPLRLIGGDREAFVAAARRALSGELRPARDQMLALAAANTWSARADALLDAIEAARG